MGKLLGKLYELSYQLLYDEIEKPCKTSYTNMQLLSWTNVMLGQYYLSNQ